jgi:hypothetical protein
MSFSYNQIVSKVEELGLDPYYDMDSLPESDRDDILDHLLARLRKSCRKP